MSPSHTSTGKMSKLSGQSSWLEFKLRSLNLFVSVSMVIYHFIYIFFFYRAIITGPPFASIIETRNWSCKRICFHSRPNAGGGRCNFCQLAHGNR